MIHWYKITKTEAQSYIDVFNLITREYLVMLPTFKSSNCEEERILLEDTINHLQSRSYRLLEFLQSTFLIHSMDLAYSTTVWYFVLELSPEDLSPMIIYSYYIIPWCSSFQDSVELRCLARPLRRKAYLFNGSKLELIYMHFSLFLIHFSLHMLFF